MNIQPLRADGGTNEEIDEIIERYKKTVYGIALCHVGNRFDADDVFQDVFLIYFKKNKSFENEEHRKAWLIRTTLNCCKKSLASVWRKKTVHFDDVPEQFYEFSSAEESIVFTAMRELPKKYLIVMHLFYFEDYSIQKIGKILNLKAVTVRVRLKRGRDFMREKLKGEYFYE